MAHEIAYSLGRQFTDQILGEHATKTIENGRNACHSVEYEDGVVDCLRCYDFGKGGRYPNRGSVSFARYKAGYCDVLDWLWRTKHEDPES